MTWQEYVNDWEHRLIHGSPDAPVASGLLQSSLPEETPWDLMDERLRDMRDALQYMAAQVEQMRDLLESLENKRRP